jgi:hypothetical protein
MNKRGHRGVDFGDAGELIIWCFVLIIVLPLIGVILAMIGSVFNPAPTCDYTPYQTNLSLCSAQVANLSDQLNQTPVKYVNVTVTEYVDKPVYKDRPIPVIITILSFAFSLFATIKLFKIKIKLPQELEEELKKIEKWIKTVKWCSLAVSILIFLRLVWILFSL